MNFWTCWDTGFKVWDPVVEKGLGILGHSKLFLGEPSDFNEPSQARFWLEPARKFAGSILARLENGSKILARSSAQLEKFWLEMARAMKILAC